jgi:phosphoglycolate phosphatase
MPLKLIIFDLDGTLVDTVQDITNALNYALMSHGIKNLNVKETMKLVGEGVTRLVEKVLPEGKEYLKDDVMKKFLKYYSENLIENSKEFPHVRETLENLNHFKKAVISNKRETLSKRLLKERDLKKYFDLIVGSDTAGERKPSPIPVLYAISKLSVRPEESIVVGDSYYDIEAGKMAGTKTVAVTYGYQPKELLKEANYVIDDLRELIPLIYEMEKIIK